VPNRRAAIVGVFNTRQGRRLEGETTESLIRAAILGVLEDSGITLADVDGVSAGSDGPQLVYDLRLGPAWVGRQTGIAMVLEAADAIAAGQADVVLIAAAQAGLYSDQSSAAPWTRPANEFVYPWGMFTAAEFALIARRHMQTYGTTPEQLATVAATIRTNGHHHPDAIYSGRGPFTPQDILDSPLVADPFHLLDCATTSEGGCALVVVAEDRARDLRRAPVWVLGGGSDYFGPAYRYPPAWDLAGRRGTLNGDIGGHSAHRAFRVAGIDRDDVDVLELYDPFSFEIIRQLEALGFCPVGEGGRFVEDGHIAIGGSHPVTTDGGTMSYSHPGATAQMLQRVIRGVEQIRGDCGDLQVPGARVALASNAGAGALFHMLAILGAD
jgi:acetyl-CoA acetyltransferase